MAQPLRAVSKRVVFVVAGAAALAAPPFLLRAEPQNWETIRRTVEENMSPSERDRLDRNTREYLALSEADRQKYRELHAALQEDIQTGNEQLASTMQDYYAWLATNQAYDREKLTTMTDTAPRIAEIQKIVDQRNDATSRARYRWSRPWLRDAPELSPDQLKSLIAVIEGRLQFTDEELVRLQDEQGQEKTGVARYFALFGILRGQRQNLMQLLERFDADELDDLLTEADIKMPPKYDAATLEGRRWIVLSMIIGNVRREYERAVDRRPPSSVDLEKVVADWPQDPAEQQKLLEMLEREPSDFRRELEQTYAKDKIALDLRDLMDMAPDIFGRGRGGSDDGQRGGERRFGPPGERPNPDRRDGRPPLGPRNGDRTPPEEGRGPRPGDHPPGDRPPPGPPPGGPRPREERPPPQP